MGAKSQPQNLQLGVDGQLTDRALRALLKHHESSSSEKELLGNELDVQVQFSLARIPGNASPKPIRIEIPHPLVKVASSSDEMEEDDSLEDVEACLIVKEESKPWVQELISRFPSQLGCVKKVLGLQSLRTKHKSFTQRRELLDRFDVFFADDRILPMLTKALGGKFFEKKKQPIPVKLTRKEALPFAIQKCLSSTFMYLSAGTCVTVKAGNTAMPPAKLLSNIQSICSIVPTNVPRKWSNIRSISIKTSSSVALPIYNKTPEELEVIMKLAKEEKQHAEKEEETEGDDKGAEKKRKMAAGSSDLAKALKKQKAGEEAEKANVEVVEKPKKSSKKKRKESMDETEEKAVKATKTPKSSKKKRKESIDSSGGEAEAASKMPAKTPKSSKKKNRKELVDDGVVQEEAKKETKTPKSSKKCKSKEEDSANTASASTKKTPKKSSDESSIKDANFISSKRFSGPKKGYVFKKGNLGNGYYKDVLPVIDKSWLASLGRKSGRGGGGGVGGSRKSTGHSIKRKKGGRSSRRSY